MSKRVSNKCYTPVFTKPIIKTMRQDLEQFYVGLLIDFLGEFRNAGFSGASAVCRSDFSTDYNYYTNKNN